MWTVRILKTYLVGPDLVDCPSIALSPLFPAVSFALATRCCVPDRVQVMTGDGDDRQANVHWLCWHCTRNFTNQNSRTRRMTIRHPRNNRLVPPPGFIELHLRSRDVGRSQAAAAADFYVLHQAAGATRSVTHARGTVRGDLDKMPSDAPRVQFGTTGFGVVTVPANAYVHGTLPVHTIRSVFQTSTAARIRAYYEAIPEASRTRRLVPPSVGRRPSSFDTPLLREALKFALRVGGVGLSQSDQRWYLSLLLMVEESGSAVRRRGALERERRGQTVDDDGGTMARQGVPSA